MDPPLTPTPPIEALRQSTSPSSSTANPQKRPQRTDYPLHTDKKAGNGPMTGRAQDRGPSTTATTTTSETRFETAPAPDNEQPVKSKSAKRKKNRNRKRRNRQESFLTTPAKEDSHDRPASGSGSGVARNSMDNDRPTSKDAPSFFKLGRNLSNTSLESDALLDHRYVHELRVGFFWCFWWVCVMGTAF